jgi:Flp pilus assembly protein TadD
MTLMQFERRALGLLVCALGTTILSSPSYAQIGFPSSPTSLPQAPLGANDPETMLANNLKILAQNPYDVDALLNAGLGSLAVGDPNAAIGFLARAEELSPRNGRVKAALGSALTQVERPDEALRLFSEAASLGIPDYALARDRGLAWDLRGDPKRAQADYVAALKYGRSDELTRRYALSLGISGSKDEALKLLDPLVKRGDQAAWRARAFIFAMNGDLLEADRIVRAVMPPEMVSVMSPFLRRLPALSLGQRAQAVNFGTIPATANNVAVIDPGDFRSVGNGASAGLASSAPRLAPVSPVTPTQIVETGRDRRAREKKDRELAKLAAKGRRDSGIAPPSIAAPTRLPTIAPSALPRPPAVLPSVVAPPVKVATQTMTPVDTPAPPRQVAEIKRAEPTPSAPFGQRVGQRVGDVDPSRIPPPDTKVTVVQGARDLPLPDSISSRVQTAPVAQSTPIAQSTVPPVKIAAAGPVVPATPSAFPSVGPLQNPSPAVIAPSPIPPASVLPAPTPTPTIATPPVAAATLLPSPSVTPASTLPATAPAASKLPPAMTPPATVIAPKPVVPTAANPVLVNSTSVPSAPVKVAVAQPVPGFSPPGGPAPVTVPSVTVAPAPGPTSVSAATPQVISQPQPVTITTPSGTVQTSSEIAPPAPIPPLSAPNLAPDFKPLPGATITVLPETGVVAPAVNVVTPNSDRVVVEAAAPAVQDVGLGSVIEGLEVEEQSTAGPIPTEAEFRARQLAAKRKEDAAAKLAADQKAKAKLAADAKTKEVAEAKAKDDAEKLAADKKDKEDAAKLKASPPRIWVQVATGANKSGLPITWKKLKADAPKALTGQSAWYAPFRATNRLLVGPFKSSGEARGLVGKLSKEGVSASTYTSEAGQDVIRLGGR